jgi:hypothetical protein
MLDLGVTSLSGSYGPQLESKKTLINCAAKSARAGQYSLKDLLSEIETLPAIAAKFMTEGDCYRWALSLLSQSSLARDLIFDAQSQGLSLSIDRDLKSPHYREDQNTLYLPLQAPSLTVFNRTALAQIEFLQALIIGLRHVWQSDTGVHLTDPSLSKSAQFLKQRILKADQDILLLAIASELRAENYFDLWRHCIGGDLYDLTMALQDHLDREPDAPMVTHLAPLVEEWFFEDTRLSECDFETLEMFEDQIESERGLAPWGSRALTRNDVYALTSLADGQSYLGELAEDILHDPIYSRTPDFSTELYIEQIEDDLSLINSGPLRFRDAELAEKLFPGILANISV